ncbi:hypothetical protein [Nocardiopsis sp. NPDC006832]|uniref:hypothetical protein n=1 Tax=Nocardiopsis sp. NPDC006832 TaxID=3157188 RepID=UPI003405AA0D
MNDTDRINGLSLLVGDLVGTLVADGRMSDAEANRWTRQADAIATGDPEHATRG